MQPQVQSLTATLSPFQLPLLQTKAASERQQYQLQQQQQQQQQQKLELANDKKSDKTKKKKRKHSFDSIFSLDSELDDLDQQAVRFKPESLENLVKLTKFNKRELKLMYRGFKQLCPSGVVKEDKFKLIYAQFFPRGADTAGYARFVFNSFDIQRKQEITFTDFVIGLSVLTRGTIDDQLRWIFTLYDINGDGVITRDELVKIVNSVQDLMGKFSLSPSQAAALEANKLAAIAAASQTGGATATSASPRPPEVASASTSNQQQQQDPFSFSPPVRAEEHAENLFKKFDLNGDGMITLDEFIEACHQDANIIKSISVFNTIL